MANSKKPRATLDPVVNALAGFLGRVDSRRVAVAYSGGRDSTLLLHGAAALRDRLGLDLLALHVHHGLSRHADAWASHALAQAAALGVNCRVLKVTPRDLPGASLEARAREARYDAMLSACVAAEVPLLLTGHHGDDQAETVLFNLARGSGLRGLSGMRELSRRGPVLVGRPLLTLHGAVLQDLIERLGLAYIQDESNGVLDHTRNALRHIVFPALEARVPDARTHIAQAAQWVRAAEDILEERGREDLEALEGDGPGLSLARLRALSHGRQMNVLRVWARAVGGNAPVATVLAEWQSQLQRGIAGSELWIFGKRYVIEQDRLISRSATALAPPARLPLRWCGEAMIDCPEWRGRLHFREGIGVARDWLAAATLELRPRRGGERLAVAADRPSRTLKNLYQEHGIDASARARLPLLFANDRLLWAARIGFDARCAVPGGPPSIRLDWESNDA